MVTNMKHLDKSRNLYLTSETELSQLKYTRVNTTNSKDSPKPGDYLLIEGELPNQVWALIGDGKYIRKCFFNSNTQNIILYRKL